MIPVIKNNIELKDEPQGAALIDNVSGGFLLISPMEAFLISLFDGTRTVDDIANIIKAFKDSPETEHILNDINQFISLHKKYIEVIDNPLEESRIKIDPCIFLDKPTNLYNRPMRFSFPRSASIYVTKKCNLNCVYCFANAEYEGTETPNNFREELSLDTINNIIDQLADMGVKEVMVTGGEIFCRSDLIRILRRLKKYEIGIEIPTNTCLINDEIAKELKELGISKIQVKLDAAKLETQDKLSGVKGTHEKLINGIKILKKHAFELTSVAVTTPWNIYEIPDVIKMCVDLGVDTVVPRIYTPGIWALKGRGGAYLNPSPESILWLEEQVGKLQTKYKGTIEISDLNFNEFGKKETNKVPFCQALVSSITILHNGLVTPCEMLYDFSEEFIIGDAKTTPLNEIWKSEKAQKWVLRENLGIGEKCISCSEFARCKGGCPYRAIVSYDEWTCDPLCIEAPKSTKIPFPMCDND